MSIKLIDLAKKFVSGQLSADAYESQFLSLWRKERDSGELAKDSSELGECLSDLFILVDCYTSDADRDSSELDANGLKAETKTTLVKFNYM